MSGYGDWIDDPAGSMHIANWVDKDDDGTDDRWQSGPGQPAQRGGGSRGTGSTSNAGRVSATGNNPTPPRSTRRRGGSVYDWVSQVADGWGMPAGWADSVLGAAKDAHTAAEFVAAIRDTPEYADRFAGNIARKEAGLPMLSETEYMSMEDSYRDALSYYGVKSFDNKDYGEWIAGNKSVAEITERAKLAGELATNGNPDLWKELKSRGITKGEATDYILNPDKALPKIQRRIDSAQMGAMARDANLDFGGRVEGTMHHTIGGRPAGTSKSYNASNRFENSLVDKGISQEAAKSAFMAVGAQQGDLDSLAGQAGVDEFDDKKLVKNELGIGGKKEAQRARTLASARRAAWGGHAGSAGGAFATGN